MHLAVVDDEPQIRESIMQKIPWKKYGFDQVSGAASAEEALDLLRQGPVDVMLCDIRMTGKSGLDLIETAVKDKYGTKFIILSGYNDFTYAQQALRLGAADYLLKPCAPSELISSVRKVLSSETHTPEPEEGELIGEDRGNCYIEAAKAYISAHYQQNISLQIIAEELHLSSAYLSHLFKQETGIKIIDYLNRVRIDAACRLLEDPGIKVYEIAEQVGYENDKYFFYMFKKYKGISPQVYRNHKGT